MALTPTEGKELFKSFITKDIKTPIMFVGESGVGKTQMIYQVGKELNKKVYVIRLAELADNADVVGIPDRKDGYFEYLHSKLLPKPSDTEGGILFLDEYNRASQELRQSVFQLITDFRMGTYILNPSYFIALAINPDNNGYQVEPIDIAMQSRVLQVEIKADSDSIIKYAMSNGWNKNVISFLSNNRSSEILCSPIEGKPYPCPRTYEKLSDILNADIINGIDGMSYEIISGLIGSSIARTFIKFMQTGIKPVDGKDILDNFDKCKSKLYDKENKFIYGVDGLNYTNHSIFSELEKIEFKLDETNNSTWYNNFMKWLEVIPNEYKLQLIVLIRDVYKKDKISFLETLLKSKIGDEILVMLASQTKNIKK